MTYKEKCLRIEHIAYEEANINENELYALLLDVVKSNALKKRLFIGGQYYDDFTHFMAGPLYMRLVNKEKPRVKSISNYINTTIKGFFDDFVKEEFKQVIDTSIIENGAEIDYALKDMFKAQCVSRTEAFNEIYLTDYIKQIYTNIKQILLEGGYGFSPSQFKSMYISIMLSMLEGREHMHRLDTRSQMLFPLILVDVKSRVSKDIIETLNSDDLVPDDISFILYNEEVEDD